MVGARVEGVRSKKQHTPERTHAAAALGSISVDHAEIAEVVHHTCYVPRVRDGFTFFVSKRTYAGESGE